MNLFLSQEITPQQLSNFEFYPKVTSRGIQQLQGAAIVVSILNSFLSTDANTIFYERDFGTTVRSLLYDPLDTTLLSAITERLTDEINASIVPPVQLLEVVPYVDLDNTTGKHFVGVNITFTFDKNIFTVFSNLSTGAYTAI